MAQCYNLSLFKEAHPNRKVPLSIPAFPLHTIFNPSTIPPPQPESPPSQAKSQFDEVHNNIRTQSPTNRLVSSTCPSTPPDFCESTKQNPFPTLMLDGTVLDGSALSPNFLRRQRGEKRPIPEEQKDDKYFERRKRNNEAAKKSRDARKMREDRVSSVNQCFHF